MNRSTRQASRLLPAVVALTITLGVATGVHAQGETVDDLVYEAEDAFRAERYMEAIRLYRKADKEAGGEALAPVLGLAQAYNRARAFKDAIDTSRRGLDLPVETEDRVRLLNQLGYGLYAVADDDPERLAEAAATFEEILTLTDGQEPTTLYNLARVRLRQGRDDEGVGHLRTYLDLAPEGPYARDAQALIDEPRRARENLAPDVSMVTLDGRMVSLEDMAGKVVLLDFWATWCSPCIAAMPSLRRLSKRGQKDPFQLISVSVDNDQTVVDQAVAEHRMDWPQVWDQYGRLARERFSVERYPTYLLIDHEGTVIYRTSGWGASIERQLMGKVSSAIRKAKRAAKQ